MPMLTTPTAILGALRTAGFSLPHLQGLFRHPLLNAEGSPVDPQVHGFEVIWTGGGCEALQRPVGGFLIALTSDDGCNLPEPHEWREALIGVYRAGEEEDVVCVTGQTWLELVDFVDLELAQMAADAGEV